MSALTYIGAQGRPVSFGGAMASDTLRTVIQYDQPESGDETGLPEGFRSGWLEQIDWIAACSHVTGRSIESVKVV